MASSRTTTPDQPAIPQARRPSIFRRWLFRLSVANRSADQADRAHHRDQNAETAHRVGSLDELVRFFSLPASAVSGQTSAFPARPPSPSQRLPLLSHLPSPFQPNISVVMFLYQLRAYLASILRNAGEASSGDTPPEPGTSTILPSLSAKMCATEMPCSGVIKL